MFTLKEVDYFLVYPIRSAMLYILVYYWLIGVLSVYTVLRYYTCILLQFVLFLGFTILLASTYVTLNAEKEGVSYDEKVAILETEEKAQVEQELAVQKAEEEQALQNKLTPTGRTVD